MAELQHSSGGSQSRLYGKFRPIYLGASDSNCLRLPVQDCNRAVARIINSSPLIKPMKTAQLPVVGDRVRTPVGQVGVVVFLTRQTAYVQLEFLPQNASLKAYLASELKKISPPVDAIR